MSNFNHYVDIQENMMVHKAQLFWLNLKLLEFEVVFSQKSLKQLLLLLDPKHEKNGVLYLK